LNILREERLVLLLDCTPCAGVIAIWCVPGKRGRISLRLDIPLNCARGKLVRSLRTCRPAL